MGLTPTPPPPWLKLVRIMRETWYVSTYTDVVSENTPFSTKNPLILLMPAFFFFLAKVVPLL